MPLYGAQPITVLGSGNITLFSAETLTPPQASMVIVRGQSPMGSNRTVSFFLEFASGPTSSVLILGSNKPPAASFTLADWVQTLYTSTNKQQDVYTDPNQFMFYCVYLASQAAGGALTAIASR